MFLLLSIALVALLGAAAAILARKRPLTPLEREKALERFVLETELPSTCQVVGHSFDTELGGCRFCVDVEVVWGSYDPGYKSATYGLRARDDSWVAHFAHDDPRILGFVEVKPGLGWLTIDRLAGGDMPASHLLIHRGGVYNAMYGTQEEQPTQAPQGSRGTLSGPPPRTTPRRGGDSRIGTSPSWG